MNTSGTVSIIIAYGSSIPNYFNRRIFSYATPDDYLDQADTSEEFAGINFNPADGINTYLDVVTDIDKYTYLIVFDTELRTIISRWFIIEADRNLGGQYRFQLKRDVVGESMLKQEFMTTAPVYVEKGILPDSDPLIVNDEGISFNKIKKSEALLNQFPYVGSAYDWGYIVGYFEKGTSTSFSISWDQTIQVNSITLSDIAAETDIPLAKLNDIFNGTAIPFAKNNPSLVYGLATNTLPDRMRIESSFSNSDLRINLTDVNNVFSWTKPVAKINANYLGIQQVLNNIYSYLNLTYDSSYIRTSINNILNVNIPGEVYLDNKQLTSLRSFIGKIITIGGTKYKIDSFDSTGEVNHAELNIIKGQGDIFDIIASQIGLESEESYNDWIMFFNYRINNIVAKLSVYEDSEESYTISIPATAVTLEDAPYSMFIIPYGTNVEFDVGDPESTSVYESISKQTALRIASELAIQLGNKLYDIQLLPYNPVASKFGLFGRFEDNTLKLYIPLKIYREQFIDEVGADPKDVEFSFIINNRDNKPRSAILFSTISNFSLSLIKKIEAENEAKIESQCNFYRLCSPNYDGAFEFNLAKNGMSVDSFLVNCTYKPINPLIRIQPEFKGLYGESFIDGRGLICGGDFSLPIIKDAWITYQQNNKNYASMFARDIQNLDISQRQEVIQERISLGSGIIGGTAAGAAVGAKAGGVYGAIAGAAAGLGLGTAGAIIDSKLSSERRAETKDLMIDRFNMNLANIKALPQTLARNSSFTILNKIFPFIEYYTCTDVEKEALRSKITYDGMTVGRVDYMINYSTNEGLKYFKGQLIRAVGLDEDNHYTNALYDEIAKGVYI